MQTSGIGFRVTRHTFFHSPDGTLRFTERSPGHEHRDDTICGCTREVAARPAGEPDQMHHEIEAVADLGDLRMSFVFTSSLWCRFYWTARPGEAPMSDETVGGPVEDRHAYFMFAADHADVRVEVAVPGYGDVDYVFGHVCVGRDVDTSRFMNGHSPSRIVKLREIGEDRVWAHDCMFGAEAVGFFGEGAEADGWRRAVRDASAVSSIMAALDADASASVDELRVRAEKDDVLSRGVASLRYFLAPIARDIGSTETFRVCGGLQERTRAAALAGGDAGDGA